MGESPISQRSLRIPETAANLDCICPLVTQVQRLTLIRNIFIDGFINQHLHVDVFFRRAQLHHQRCQLKTLNFSTSDISTSNSLLVVLRASWIGEIDFTYCLSEMTLLIDCSEC